MIYKIENETYIVKVKDLSAELTSVVKKDTGREYMWQQGEEIFKNQAKNLFPNCGMVNRERIFVEGKEYPLMQHGFAKDMVFNLCEQNETKVDLFIEANDYTRKYYPYEFEFHVIFELVGDKLNQYYKVVNKDKKDIYFGVGAHTGFYCPILLSEKPEDYILDFGDNDNIVELVREDREVLLTGEEKPFKLDNGIYPLSDHTFDKGAFILTNFKERKVVLKSKKSKASISIKFDDFPYCTFWSRTGNLYYICIEPWCGLPDSVDTDHNFETKKGNNKVEVGKEFIAKQEFIFT